MNAIDQTTAIERLKAEREQLVDALDHIQRTCNGSRTQTRRLRWIGIRARSAIHGDDEWKDADVPVIEPMIEKLQGIIARIFPVVARELEGLVSSYSELSDAERARATFEAIVESIVDPDDAGGVKADVKTMHKFIGDARRAVPALNIEQLKQGEAPVELQRE